MKSDPYKNQTTTDLKRVVEAVSKQAGTYAATGPKKSEDAAHEIVNDLLDEIQRRSI